MPVIGKEERKLEVNYHLMACNASLYSGAFNHFDDLFSPLVLELNASVVCSRPEFKWGLHIKVHVRPLVYPSFSVWSITVHDGCTLC